MFNAFSKAVFQLNDPRTRKMLWLSIGAALTVFAVLWTVIGTLLTSTSFFAIGWLEWAVDLLGGLATGVMTWFLFPGVITAVICLFFDDIAAAARVSKATLYSYFADKRLMFEEAMQNERQRLEDAILFDIPADAAPTQAIPALTRQIAEWLVALPFSPTAILIAILAGYAFLGMFLSASGMMLLTLPVIFPAVVELGIDPILFGILVIKMVEIGFITPPVGLNVYVVAGVRPDIPIASIFGAIWPFVLIDILTVALLILFPSITLFLPNLVLGAG